MCYQMLSAKRCAAILNRGGKKYSDGEVKCLRDILYKLGYVDYDNFKQRKRTSDDTGDHLHQGLD